MTSLTGRRGLDSLLVMKCLLFTILCFTSSLTWAENLLSNPGFDRLKLDGSPAHWDLFVMPNNKALGRADSTAHDGYYSAMLYTPTPYANDPMNNWSQVVYDNLIGVELELTGNIRTENVTEAALWIQCFSKKRSRILATATSSSDFYLIGTQGWTQVRTEITPPKNTDFIVVRCIIQGSGKAWFDTLSLSVKKPDALEAPIDELDTLLAQPVPHSNNSDILALSQAMQKTIRKLETSNRELLKRIATIQSDLEQYRNEITEESQATLPKRGVHPLVPLDYKRAEDTAHE